MSIKFCYVEIVIFQLSVLFDLFPLKYISAFFISRSRSILKIAQIFVSKQAHGQTVSSEFRFLGWVFLLKKQFLTKELNKNESFIERMNLSFVS